MAHPEPIIDNTIRYAKKPKLNMLAFTVLFFITGMFAIIKFDSYFTDFWKIKDCKTDGYARGDFMTSCGDIKVDRYSYGSIYLGVQKDAVDRARNADVLIFGNSRTARSFSTDTIDQYFKEKNLTYMNLAAEGTSYRAALLMMESLKIKPKIILVNNEIFYTTKISPAFRELVDYPNKYKTRFQFFHAAQSLHKKVCASGHVKLKSFYCEGKKGTGWRSGVNGQILKWNLIAPPEKQKLLSYDPNSRLPSLGRLVGNAENMTKSPALKGSCPILYLVNSPVSSPKLMEQMAEELGVLSAFAPMEGLYSYDGSHLDRPNSEKWARGFIKILDPVIDTCLKSKWEIKPREVDLNAVNTQGKTDFEKWRLISGTTITDDGAIAPDKTQSADIIYFPKRAAKLQKLLRGQPIEKGSTLKYSIWLWSEQNARIRLQIVKSCARDTPMENENLMAALTSIPKRFELSLTFEHDHKCSVLQIVSLDEDKSINAWRGKVDYMPPPEPAIQPTIVEE